MLVVINLSLWPFIPNFFLRPAARPTPSRPSSYSKAVSVMLSGLFYHDKITTFPQKTFMHKYPKKHPQEMVSSFPQRRKHTEKRTSNFVCVRACVCVLLTTYRTDRRFIDKPTQGQKINAAHPSIDYPTRNPSPSLSCSVAVQSET